MCIEQAIMGLMEKATLGLMEKEILFVPLVVDFIYNHIQFTDFVNFLSILKPEKVTHMQAGNTAPKGMCKFNF